MKMWVEVLGSMDELRVVFWEDVLDSRFRYVCSDLERDFDIFEDSETGELVATRLE